MNIMELKLPLPIVAAIAVSLVSGLLFLDSRHALASDFKAVQIEQSINQSMVWIAILEGKLERATTEKERKDIQRQLDITTKRLYIQMENQNK